MACDVALVPCGDYEEQRIEQALREAVGLCGGLEEIHPGTRVVLKVNLVSALKPEKAATVHPSVVCAMVRILKEAGAQVVIGDSPGGLYTAAYVRHVYEVCGMREAEKYGAVLNDDFSVREGENPEAVKARMFTYTAYLDRADVIIDLCKLKSHGMMGMSNAVKNFFGVVPGTMKPEYHYKYPKIEDFADMIVDLYEYFRPCLCVCDAVEAMEGNGPTQGTPRTMGCLLVSKNGHKLDLIGANLIGLTCEGVPTLAAAIRRGLITGRTEDISVSRDPETYRQQGFKTIPAQPDSHLHFGGNGWIWKGINAAARKILPAFPKLIPDRCVGCGRCRDTCPAGAITMRGGKPRIRRRQCIHCFCCQEFCPKGALEAGRHRILRMLLPGAGREK